MPLLVAFGAGNVGRGFIGDLFASAGWRVVFLDVAPALVDALHTEGSYIHQSVTTDTSTTRILTGIDAAYSTDQGAVDRLITEADLVTTSVGARILPRIAPALAHGLNARWDAECGPLDILLCENLHDASSVVRDLLTPHINSDHVARLDALLGLAETSIGRMIPAPAPLPDRSPTLIRVEPYRILPYDATALRGPEPEVDGLYPVRDIPFAFYADRKLLLHNMGHCMCAYLGERLGYTYIWQAIDDPRIRSMVQAAMHESALALATAYHADPTALARHVDDLIARFSNQALGDTLERVGKDPARKLAPNDRILGAYRLARSRNTPLEHLSLAAALGTARLAREPDWSPRTAQHHVETALFADDSIGRSFYHAQLDALGSSGFDWHTHTRLIDSAATRTGVV